MDKIEDKLGVYDVLDILPKDNVYTYHRLKLKCSECGAIKITRLGNKRHFMNTKFCRCCPPEVRKRVYGETWDGKKGDPETNKLLSEKELKSREQWVNLNKGWPVASE